MIELYHCLGARSFRPLWTLEELGIPYQLKVLPFPPRALAKSYLQINSLGTVPALFDDGMAMTESAAICQYLAARYGPSPLDVGPAEADFGQYLNWLHHGEATLSFPQTLILRYGRFEPVERRNPQVVEDYRRWFLGRLRKLGEVLEQQEYLCAGRFTAADISVGYALMLAEYLGLEPEWPASVRRYWQRQKSRPAFERACASEQRAAVEQGVSTVPAPLTQP